MVNVKYICPKDKKLLNGEYKDDHIKQRKTLLEADEKSISLHDKQLKNKKIHIKRKKNI